MERTSAVDDYGQPASLLSMDTSEAITAGRQLTRTLRELTARRDTIECVPAAFLADLERIVKDAERAFGQDEVDRAEAKALARWLWNRGFGSADMAAFGTEHRSFLMASAGAQSSTMLWQSAAGLISRVEVRIKEDPALATTLGRRALEHEREQWLPAAQEPVPEPEADERFTDPADLFKNSNKAKANRKAKAKVLARWLWDRNLDASTVRAFSPKYRREIARAAGANPPSTMETWEIAFALMDSMEARVVREPNNPVTFRHHVEEHQNWVNDPHAERAAV